MGFDMTGMMNPFTILAAPHSTFCFFWFNPIPYLLFCSFNTPKEAVVHFFCADCNPHATTVFSNCSQSLYCDPLLPQCFQNCIVSFSCVNEEEICIRSESFNRIHAAQSVKHPFSFLFYYFYGLYNVTRVHQRM